MLYLTPEEKKTFLCASESYKSIRLNVLVRVSCNLCNRVNVCSHVVYLKCISKCMIIKQIISQLTVGSILKAEQS